MLGHYGSGQFGNNYARTDQDNNFATDQSFQGHINLGLNQELRFDNDRDTYATASLDDQVEFFTSGGLRHVMTTASIQYTVNINALGNALLNVGQIRMDEIARPAAIANHGQIYTRDIAGTAEVHVQDDGGVETQISSHGLHKKWQHISQIKDERTLIIEMEKFMIENFPEYVIENNIRLREKVEILSNGGSKITKKFKWYQVIKKYRYKKKVKQRL
jgi:hypothetical protein